MELTRINCLIAFAPFGVLAAAGPAFSATGKVYVADEASTVFAIEVKSLKRMGTVGVGEAPKVISVTPL